MSKEIPTIKGATYVVTPLTDGTVTAPDGRIIASFTVGQQVSFAAPGNFVIISDEEAFVDIYFNPAAPAGVGGGKTNSTELHEHLADRWRHLSADERAFLETVFPGFGADTPVVPEGALSGGAILAHFAFHAQPGDEVNPAAMSAPSAVFISRVPWGRKEDEIWVNNDAAVNEEVFGVAQKLMDNAGLRHECSTDTVEGVDDYNGKLWPFYWQHANYISDEHGIKHVTAIKGVHEQFDPHAQNVCSFGPAFWFFCCLERSKKSDGTWNTHDGTENGTPLFQLWGISCRAWNDLDEERREQLCALGVSEADFHLWPSAQVWDAQREELVARPYWCHSAYFGGAEKQEDGSYMMVSKPNLPIFKNLSHNAANALYDWKPGFGGSASVQGFGVLFDIVKNATKNSQSIHAGLSYDDGQSILAAYSTAEPGYLFPIAAKGNFELGATVMLGQKFTYSYDVGYKLSKEIQVGRIAAIETRTITLSDGSMTESLCLVISPETVAPFLVRSGTSEDAEARKEEAIAATKQLTDSDIYACCYATQGLALTGEPDRVIGKHDGSCISLTNSRHPYRVQGTEYQLGAWCCALDTVAVKGTGELTVTVDGVESTPSASDYVMMQAGSGVTRRTGGTLRQFLDSGYTPVGIIGTTEGWIVNVHMSHSGVIIPDAVGGKGSGSSKGHGDYLYLGTSTAAVFTGGHLLNGTYAGSTFQYLKFDMSSASWSFASRD